MMKNIITQTPQCEKNFKTHISRSLMSCFLLIFLLNMQGVCQSISNYSFTASSGTYSSITGGTSFTYATGSNADDGWANSVTLPWSFTLNGTSYSSFNVSTNGFITFGSSLVNSISNNALTPGGLATSAKRPIIAALWDDIYPGSLT